ncbi:MAG TPA: PAS domain S-box protein, partial [Patescibacteria group bacterium]|nr:PAS domain S-box protein [Patescibacteria group bacterium]
MSFFIPFAALALIFTLQSIAGAGPVIAFPFYLSVVLVSALRSGRAPSLVAAAVAALALVARALLNGGPAFELESALLLAVALPVVAVAIAEVNRQAQSRARQVGREAAAAAASEQRMRSIVEAATVGLAITDAVGRFTLANRSFEEITGRGQDSLYAMTLPDLVADPDRVAVLLALSQLGDGSLARWEAELTQRRPDGSTVPIAIVISRVSGSGPEVALLVQETDVSARKRVDALRDGLVKIQDLMVNATDAEVVAPELLAVLCRYLDWDAAIYWAPEPDTDVLRSRYAWPAGGDPLGGTVERKGVSAIRRGVGLVGRVWLSGAVTVGPAPGAAQAAGSGPPEAAAEVAVPVVAAGTVIAVIELLSDRGRPVPADEVALLTTAGLELGQFIRRSAIEQALRRSEADHRAIFERSRIGIARVGADGELVEANPALLQMLEYDLKTMRSKSWPDLLRAYDQAATRQGVAPLLAGMPVAGSLQVRAATGGGRWLWLQLTAATIPDSAGNPEHVLVMVEDVTGVRETSDKLAEALEAQRSANANLERLDRTKTEFLSLTSHEFRTALTGIQGVSELIRDGGLDSEEVRSYGGYIFNDADRVNRLIGDMLDLDRMESGRMTIRTADVDVNEVLAEAVARARTNPGTVEF